MKLSKSSKMLPLVVRSIGLIACATSDFLTWEVRRPLPF